jgi:hypothetical protein
MLSQRAAFIVSCVLVVLCYVNSLPNEFVFDDGPIVASNPAIRSIDPIRFLQSPYWTEQQYEGIYRPFTIFSLSIDYALWQRWAPGYRVTNLAVHAINGVLVFLLASSLIATVGVVYDRPFFPKFAEKLGAIDRPYRAIPAAAMIIFVVHPVHNEAVTGIIGRSELFATCFLLAAWLLFRHGHTVAPAALFLLALLAKESAIVLPGILLLDAMWSSQVTASRQGRLKAILIGFNRLIPAWRLAVILAVAAAYLVLRFSVLGGLGIPASAQYMGGQLSAIERVMTSGRVFIEYVRLTAFPLHLAGDYDFNVIPLANLADWDAWLGLLSIGGAVALALVLKKKNWMVSFAILFAFLVLLPTSNWIMPISVLMAERFLYLPLAGLSFGVAIVYCRIQDFRLRRLAAAGGLTMAIVLCNSHDYVRRNDFTFFGNMVRVAPNSAKGRLGYGYALLQAGMKEDAARQFEEGLKIIPDYPALLTMLAMTKTTPTDCSQGWPLLQRALQINPGHAGTQRRMADCYFQEGKTKEAESMYRQAVDGTPYPDSMLYFMWGRSLEDMGQTEAAVSAYQRAELIDSSNVFIKQRLSALKSPTGATLKK